MSGVPPSIPDEKLSAALQEARNTRPEHKESRTTSTPPLVPSDLLSRFLKEAQRAKAARSPPKTAAAASSGSTEQKRRGTTCTVCGTKTPIYYTYNERLYCEDHYYETAVGFCNSCSQRITADTPYRRVENRPWHDSCLVCKRCGESVLSGYYEDQDTGNLFCTVHCKGNWLFASERAIVEKRRPASKVVAIDFGTSRSGWAWTDPHKADRDRQVYHDKRGPKQTRTCVLRCPDGSTVFGDDAYLRFLHLPEEEHKQYRFWDRFKMTMHKALRLGGKTISPAHGEPETVLTVVTWALQSLVEEILASLRNLTGPLSAKDIDWVLTVPAIWAPESRNLMEKALTQVSLTGEPGILQKHIDIAVEPEAAAIRCIRDHNLSLTTMKRGSVIVMADLGGGTGDITVHEVDAISPLKLYETVPPAGGKWGSNYIDEAFMALLDKAVGYPCTQRLRERDPKLYAELQQNFEMTKMEFNPTMTYLEWWNVTIPQPAFDSFLNREFGDGECSESDEDEDEDEDEDDDARLRVETLIGDFKGDEKLQMRGDDVLQIHISTMLDLFDVVLRPTVQALKGLLSELGRADFLFLVGGLGASECTRQRFTEEFTPELFPTLKVVCPGRPGLAVVQGAAMYGADPDVVKGRSMPYFFAVEISPKFIEGEHDLELKSLVIADGCAKYVCNKVADILVSRGERIMTDEAINRTYRPAADGMTRMSLEVFYSSEGGKYIRGDHWKSCGKVTVPMPDLTGETRRKVKVHFVFGGTQIYVYATNQTPPPSERVMVTGKFALP